jgi:hypothetical protein
MEIQTAISHPVSAAEKEDATMSVVKMSPMVHTVSVTAWTLMIELMDMTAEVVVVVVSTVTIWSADVVDVIITEVTEMRIGEMTGVAVEAEVTKGEALDDCFYRSCLVFDRFVIFSTLLLTHPGFEQWSST